MTTPSRVTQPQRISLLIRDRDRLISAGRDAANAVSRRPAALSLIRTVMLGSGAIMQNDYDRSEDERTTLKWLRILVLVLTVTMIGGFLVIVVLFILKFQSLGQATLPLPEEITLAPGQEAAGFVQGDRHFYVITRNDTIRVHDAVTGTLVQEIRLVE